MAVSRRRDRLVYFRISEDEFEQVVKACEAKGARSISDLARTAIKQFVEDRKAESEQKVIDGLRELGVMMNELKQSIAGLASAAASNTGANETQLRTKGTQRSEAKMRARLQQGTKKKE